MMHDLRPCVYIICNDSRTVLYTGVTSDIERRAREHRSGEIKGFTSRYAVSRMVFVEYHPTMMSAIEREKQIKSWSRERKVRLIVDSNPQWCDLMADDELRVGR